MMDDAGRLVGEPLLYGCSFCRLHCEIFLRRPAAAVRRLRQQRAARRRLAAEHRGETLGVGKLVHGGGERDYFQTYGGGLGGFGPSSTPTLHYPEGHPLWDWGAYREADGVEDADMPDARIADWASARLAQPREHARAVVRLEPVEPVVRYCNARTGTRDALYNHGFATGQPVETSGVPLPAAQTSLPADQWNP